MNCRAWVCLCNSKANAKIYSQLVIFGEGLGVGWKIILHSS
jgi:hypothetical protein